ncbi:hypothetical protein Mmc1_0622 [Magnetococcus marinus MC-1]|uniref:Thioredoxin domain-containing protein n=1 Tax=Magnetococcus marinus (strain ATCC BAA-1437 / JCM 17883 / MC-1) TaxID=156889 RepID=A0L5A0_MAGMM|nr:thioredoxin family protein [Magnetococcus marinus]ABK43143.1 hypothetical protein Mmc1_0622 [Magnetococcus marinus MC-1]
MAARQHISLWLLGLWCLLCGPVYGETLAQEVGTLIYVGSDHCPYCRKFEQEVGEVYPKTALSKQLPLVKVDHDRPVSRYAQLNRKVHFVPAYFILGKDDQIQASFSGYRGEEFWWYDLERLVAKLQGVKETQALLLKP